MVTVRQMSRELRKTFKKWKKVQQRQRRELEKMSEFARNLAGVRLIEAVVMRVQPDLETLSEMAMFDDFMDMTSRGHPFKHLIQLCQVMKE
jgi:hypothetical protein